MAVRRNVKKLLLKSIFIFKLISFRNIKQPNFCSLSFGEGWGEDINKKLFYISKWYNINGDTILT
jgi:hypothetical protein